MNCIQAISVGSRTLFSCYMYEYLLYTAVVYSCIYPDTSHAPCYSCMLYEYEYAVQQSCFDMHRTHRFMQLRFVESWYLARYRYRYSIG